MNGFDQLHDKYVHNRRVVKLSEHLTKLIPMGASLLDVGCGDGLIANLITKKRSDIKVNGVDVLIREKSYFPIDKFDGEHLPYPDKDFDVVMLVDVLHHTVDANILLSEAKRVARKYIILKDHTCNGFLAGPTLRFMDYVGNAKYGVNLPYNYWSKQQWHESLDKLGVKIDYWEQKLEMYPKPADYFFGRNLHFIAKLEIK